MNDRLQRVRQHQRGFLSLGLITIAVVLLISTPLPSQTPATGALAAVAVDTTGALLPGVVVRLTNEDNNASVTATSDELGRFSFLLLSPGAYLLQANKANFEILNLSHFHISVTETLRLELRMKVAIQIESVQIVSKPVIIQTDTSALGRVVNESAVSGLPLVTRNFAKITELSPGVVVGVSNRSCPSPCRQS
jgi:hypothetical protein